MEELLAKSKELAKLESKHETVVNTMMKFRSYQSQALTQVNQAQNQTKELMQTLRDVLWDFIPSHLVDQFCHIPKIQPDLVESKTQVGDYRVGDMIGEGEYAHVFSIFNSNGKELAMKRINKRKYLSLDQLKRMDKELAVLQVNQHPGLLQPKAILHSHQALYIISEKGKQDLFQYTEINPKLTEPTIRRLAQSIGLALLDLHRSKHCHRDLKPYVYHFFFLVHP